MLLLKLKVIIQSTNFIFHVPWKMVRMHTAFLITDYFNSSNSIILWICTLYKHSFIFLMVFVSRWLRYLFLLYLQKCRILKNIRTIYPLTVQILINHPRNKSKASCLKPCHAIQIRSYEHWCINTSEHYNQRNNNINWVWFI